MDLDLQVIRQLRRTAPTPTIKTDFWFCLTLEQQVLVDAAVAVALSADSQARSPTAACARHIC